MTNERREKSLPLIMKSHHKSKPIIPDDTLKPLETEYVAKPNKIKSGLMLKKVYNVENLEIERPKSARKAKEDKTKTNDNRTQKKIEMQKREKEKLKIKTQEKALEKKKQDKLNKIRSQERLDKLQNKNSDKSNVGLKRRQDSSKESSKEASKESSKKPPKESPSQIQNVENRLSTRIWHIMNRDNDKLYSKLHATDSEMKRHIISVIKKYNTKELKNLNRRETQTTSLESISSRGSTKQAIKRKVRKQLWYLAKNAIKNNEHWRSFLAENNIVVDNINIDKFDISLIDVDALGIENKLLKRTIVWLFK